MTTGRINQVTILKPWKVPRGTRPGDPPRGVEFGYEEGAPPRWYPAIGARNARRSRAAAGYSIAPTEFPKGRSAAEVIRLREPPNTAASALQVEGTTPQITPKGGYWFGPSPENLVER